MIISCIYCSIFNFLKIEIIQYILLHKLLHKIHTYYQLSNMSSLVTNSENVNKHIDMMITSMMFKNNDNSSILANIINFIIVVCADDVKTLVKFIINNAIDSLKNMWLFFVGFFSSIIKLNYFENIHNNNMITVTKKFDSDEKKTISNQKLLVLKIDNLHFVKDTFYKILKDNPKNTEIVTSHLINEKTKSINSVRNFNNPTIEYKNIKILFTNCVVFNIDTDYNSYNVLSLKCCSPNKCITKFSDLISSKRIGNIVDMYYNLTIGYHFNKSISSFKNNLNTGWFYFYKIVHSPNPFESNFVCNTLSGYIEYCGSPINKNSIYMDGVPHGGKILTKDNYQLLYIAEEIETNFNIDMFESFWKIIILNSVLNFITSKNLNMIDKIYKNISFAKRVFPDLKINDKKNTFLHSSICPPINSVSPLNLHMSSIWMLIENYDVSLSKFLTFDLKYFDNIDVWLFINNLMDNSFDKSVDNSTGYNDVVIEPIKHDMTYMEIEQEYNNFLLNLYTRNTTSSNQKIKIFLLKIKSEVWVSSIPNPKYEEYEEKKTIVNKILSQDNKNNCVEISEFLKMPHEPKHFTVENTRSIVEPIEINSKFKHISKLYLQEKSKQKLLAHLENYQNNKLMLEELGIQNQLGIILYGEPGTGKSSTILAVASELQKDIYYLDFQTIKTNKDLTIAVDYVTKLKNSIIVCEDIDCACPIVLKRTYNNDQELNNGLNVSNLIDEEKNELTLEYFLNILQGTLTVDDFICIVTTNHLEKLDPAFIREGRFNVQIEMKKCDHFQIKKIFRDFIGRDISQEILEQIEEYKFAPVSIITRCVEFLSQRYEKDEVILHPFL